MTTQQPSHQHQHQHQQGDLTVYRSSSNLSDFAFCFGGRSGSVEHLQERFLLDFQEPLGHGNRRFLSKRDLDIQRLIDIYDLHGQDRWDFQKHLLKSFLVRYDFDIRHHQHASRILLNFHANQTLATHRDCPPVGHPVLKNSIKNFTMRNNPWGIFWIFWPRSTLGFDNFWKVRNSLHWLVVPDLWGFYWHCEEFMHLSAEVKLRLLFIRVF